MITRPIIIWKSLKHQEPSQTWVFFYSVIMMFLFDVRNYKMFVWSLCLSLSHTFTLTHTHTHTQTCAHTHEVAILGAVSNLNKFGSN